MQIKLNGENCQTEANTLEAALEQFGYQDTVIATALNGQFIPEALRKTTLLTEGDQIEALAPMQGG